MFLFIKGKPNPRKVKWLPQTHVEPGYLTHILRSLSSLLFSHAQLTQQLDMGQLGSEWRCLWLKQRGYEEQQDAPSQEREVLSLSSSSAVLSKRSFPVFALRLTMFCLSNDLRVGAQKTSGHLKWWHFSFRGAVYLKELILKNGLWVPWEMSLGVHTELGTQQELKRLVRQWRQHVVLASWTGEGTAWFPGPLPGDPYSDSQLSPFHTSKLTIEWRSL